MPAMVAVQRKYNENNFKELEEQGRKKKFHVMFPLLFRHTFEEYIGLQKGRLRRIHQGMQYKDQLKIKTTLKS